MQGREAWKRWRGRVWCVGERLPWPAVAALLFVLALGLRLWRLTYHSFWFDEAVSAGWAGWRAADIVRVGMELTLDKHPPVYYLLLRGWTLLFGTGDAAVRSLGALLGALIVFPIFALGQRWQCRAGGAVAALLAAINPFLVWYSQEARMFMPAATFALLGLWAFVSLLDDARSRRRALLAWGIFVVATLAGVYAYLFNALLLPVAGLWWLLAVGRAWRADRRRLSCVGLAGGSALAVVAVGFWPLARQAWAVSGAEATPGRAFQDAGVILWQLGHAFLFNKARLGSWGDGLLALAALAVLIGLWPGSPASGASEEPSARPAWRGRSRSELAVALLVPWLIGNLLLIRDARAFAEPRYWLFLVPFVCLTWAAASVRLIANGRLTSPIARTGAGLLGGLLLVSLLAASLVALPWNWRPESRREDWRAAADYVARHAGPDDAILIHVDYVRRAFLRYYRGDLPVFFPFGGRLDDLSQVEPPLAGMGSFATIWLIESHLEGVDDGRLLEQWLGQRYPLTTEQFPAGIALRAYAVRTVVERLPVDAQPLEAELGPGLTLAGCRLAETEVPARDDVYHPPSGWAHVALYWRRTGEPAADARPRLHLIDAIGQVWGVGLARERSLWGMWPPSQWPTDGLVRDEHDVNLNPATPPGDYRLQVAIVGADGQPLGPEANCGAIRVR